MPPAPAPVAPTPTTSPAPSPSHSSSPAPATKPSTGNSFDDAFGDGDEPSPTPAPAQAPVAPAPALAPKPASPAPAKPAEPAKPAPAPAGEPPKPGEDDDAEPPAVANVGQMRRYAQQQRVKAKHLKEELAKAQADLKAAKEASPAPGGQDVVAISNQLKEAQERLKTYEQDLQVTRYERSQEYKEKFHQPWERAIDEAYEEIKTLNVRVTNAETGEETTRNGTAEDFNDIYNAASSGQAISIIKSKFGEVWGAEHTIALDHYKKARALGIAKYKAVEEHKAKGGEMEKAEQAKRTQEQIQQQQASVQAFKASVGKMVKADPDFAIKDGDKEWNEKLAEGRKDAMEVFMGDRSKLSTEQKAELDAKSFNRTAAYPALKHQISKLSAQVAEMEKTIAELRGSGPGVPTPGSGQPDAKDKTGAEGFDAAFPN